ncbi:MAG: dTDP-4-dehydrorhamnose reductase [Anaerolineaceae bacterium]|nr:dTDP-4-dehydrorhamnose reductase [Anaerolineaceae bacterium]
MKKILLLGKNGQVGWEAWRTLSCLGEVIALDYPDVDFTRPQTLETLVNEIKPGIIYNAAAYTAVDRAESEPELARAINATAVGALAQAARKTKAVLVHFSTDYVFDGKKGSPYVESDRPNPLNHYGVTKLEGEQAIQQVDCAYLTFRTTWVYSMRRDSFVSKVLQWSKGKPSLRVVSDQVSSPTWARALAEATGQVLARGGSELVDWVYQRRGIYHLAGAGSTSRMNWAKAILNNRPEGEAPVEVIPALSSEFPTPAERPLFSVLDCSYFSATFDLQLPPWEKALGLAMEG